MSTSPPCKPFPALTMLAISAAVVVGVGVSSLDPTVDFTPYFAALPPLAAASIVCVFGIGSLYLLQARQGLCVQAPGSGWRTWAIATGLAIPFMAAVTLADLSLKFPAAIAVRLPTSLLFYPAMGFLAQLSLHVVPFMAALRFLALVCRDWSTDARIRIAIFLSALPEAIFQLAGTPLHGSGAQGLSVFVAAQIFVFGVVEMNLYRRFDFFRMYAFRLTYYGYWHIVWASLRN